ncbi:MAG TPA: RNA polymerase subunit sigma-70, partial [Acidimicrobiales bacterium]|nr:RNA polymerase subunit sigma-70 [Acidimicrobiales bacterium]
STVRTWLYRIATNVCTDMLRGRQRRGRPMAMGPARPPEETSLAFTLAEESWVVPAPDRAVLDDGADPAETAVLRDSVRLAFVAALQHLPARQRGAVLLCDVFRWPASETAELLATSVASVNSALQRARATLAELGADQPVATPGPGDAELVERFLDAFERYDIPLLITLLREDAVQSMPPFAMWLEGAEDIGHWMLGPGSGCRGSRVLATEANGCPAFGQYRVDPAGGHAPWGLHVVEIEEGRVTGLHTFLDPELFPLFELPTHLPD